MPHPTVWKVCSAPSDFTFHLLPPLPSSLFSLPSPFSLLQLFRPEEIELLVCGSPLLDLGALEDVAVYDGYSKDDSTVRWVWQPARWVWQHSQVGGAAWVGGWGSLVGGWGCLLVGVRTCTTLPEIHCPLLSVQALLGDCGEHVRGTTEEAAVVCHGQQSGPSGRGQWDEIQDMQSSIPKYRQE